MNAITKNGVIPLGAIKFTKETLFVSRGMKVDDEEINKMVGQKLLEDYHATREKLIKQTLYDRLGRLPSLFEAKKHLKQCNDKKTFPGLTLVWFFWDKRAVCVHTHPKSFLRDEGEGEGQKCWYNLAWHFASVPKTPQKALPPIEYLYDPEEDKTDEPNHKRKTESGE